MKKRGLGVESGFTLPLYIYTYIQVKPAMIPRSHIYTQTHPHFCSCVSYFYICITMNLVNKRKTQVDRENKLTGFRFEPYIPLFLLEFH